jgi:predicted anti-sigma-YlaC factor YlaD
MVTSFGFQSMSTPSIVMDSADAVDPAPGYVLGAYASDTVARGLGEHYG